MFNWYPQLTKLVFDFYRENPYELQRLRPLRTCKVSRRWGTLRVNCRDYHTACELAEAGLLLREPIAQLRLAQQINILVNGTLFTSMPVKSPKLRT